MHAAVALLAGVSALELGQPSTGPAACAGDWGDCASAACCEGFECQSLFAQRPYFNGTKQCRPKGTCVGDWGGCEADDECCEGYECKTLFASNYSNGTQMCRSKSTEANGTCAKEWQRCTDAQTCCDGLTCEGSEWYKMCRNASSMSPAAAATGPSCAGAMQQCGGGSNQFSSFQGPTECCAGYECKINQYYSGYSECQPTATTDEPSSGPWSDAPARCLGAYELCNGAAACCANLSCGDPSFAKFVPTQYRGSKMCRASDAGLVDDILAMRAYAPGRLSAAVVALCLAFLVLAAVAVVARRQAARTARRELDQYQPLIA